MKVTRIERQISHKIFLGGFETIEPTVRLVAELEGTEDVAAAKKLLDDIIEREWLDTAIHELWQVKKRRDIQIIADDKLDLLLLSFRDQRSQLDHPR